MNVPLRPLAFILSLLFTASSFAVDVSHTGNGRYQTVSNPAGGVWIVDSQTGDAKLCFKKNVYEAAPEVNCIKEKSDTVIVYDQQGNLINGTDADDVVNKWVNRAKQQQAARDAADALNDALITKMKERIAELEAKQDKE